MANKMVEEKGVALLPPHEKGMGAYAANVGPTTGRDRQGLDLQKEIKASRCVKEVWPPFYDRPVGRGADHNG